MMTSILEGHILQSLIFKCRYEAQNIDEQIEYLYEINRMLPDPERLIIPSLISNDYISKVLDIIEEAMFSIK